MKILAIDFAWRCSGWVLVEDGKPIKWGLIKTKPLKGKNSKIEAVIDHERGNYSVIFSEILYLSNYHNIHIVAEVPYFSQKANDAILIGLGWALLHNLQSEFITASMVKEKLLGSKVASKKEIAEYVHKNGGLKLMFEKHHIKDAYAAYLAWDKMTKVERMLK